MAITIEEIKNKGIVKGANYDLAWKKSVATLKKNPEAQGVEVFKATSMTGQFEIPFDSKTTIDWSAYNEAHERGETPNGLKFVWLVENLVGKYISNGNEFIRINTTANSHPKTVWTKRVNGIETEITKDEAERLCGNNAKSKPNDSGCISVSLANVVSFARNH